MTTTIHPYSPDDDLETKIAAVVAITTEFAKDGQRNRRKLRRLFADLAELKAKRNPSVIHRLESQIGLGELV